MMKTYRSLSLAVVLILSCPHALNAQTQTQIGVTTYDLQSNSAVQNRIINHGDGTISAVWTYSESYDIAAADRGTGYNFYNGATWGAIPTTRIESEKTGWPSIATTAGGTEVFLCHNIAQGPLTQGSRTTIGSGPWSLSNVTNTDQVWSRMAIGGANGQTIHHVSLYDPFGGPWPNGVQSQMLYWRSQDGGATYDIQEMAIPGLDETNYSAFSGDSYHIAAKGDTVVVVYFGDLSPTIMAKSTDNGTTWTTTTLINVFPPGVTYDAGSVNTTGSVIGITDINGDGIADTVTATDGSGWVLMDQNGMVHIFYGNMRYLDDTPGDDTWSYFPGTNGLMYWNESFGEGPPLMIGASMDLDNSGTLDIVGIAMYFQSLSTFPSAGIAANGCIYVSYSAVVENMDQGTQNYRHIYITRSCDGGCSWTTPKDVTPGSGFEENVYASMARLVDSDIHIVFQRDFEPGIAVNGDNDAYVLNDIIYLKVPTIDYDTVSTAVCYTNILGDSMYCAGDSVLLTASCGTAWLWSTGETSQSIYYSGVWGTVTVDITTDCGVIQNAKALSSPSSPPVVNVTSTLSEMCPGDTAELTVTSNAGGNIVWSTAETTATISVLASGTYSVTVSNCGGSSVASVVINTPSPPTAIVTASSSTMCTGDSVTVWVNPVSQGSYLWSTGAATTSIIVTSAGTYSVTVTNCAGSDVGSILISLPAPPVASISGNVPFCNGDSIILTAGAQPSATYAWSNGDSTQSIVVSDEATYTVTVTNCGGADNTSVTTSYHPAPSIAVTTGALEFCEDIGTADVTLSAFAFGADPFIYVWSNGDTTQFLTLDSVAHSGVYTVTVIDVCGNTAVGPADTVTINDSPIADTVSVTNCSSFGVQDGAIATSVTGGNGPFTYLWNDPAAQTTMDASNLFSGTYTLLVTDANGCTDALTVFVNQPLFCALNLSTTSTDPTGCGTSDGAASVTVSGGTSPYTYSWSNGGNTATITGLTGGTYSVTVTDANSCLGNTSVTLTTSGAPTLTITTTDASCSATNGTASVFVNGGTTPYTYLWNDPDSQNTSIATGLASGNYTVTVTDGTGCIAISSAFVGMSGTGPTLSIISTDVSCFGETDGSAAVSPSGGTSPYTYLWSTGSNAAIITNLPAGTYSLQVTDNIGCTTNGVVTITEPSEIITIYTTVDPSCGNSDGVASLLATGGTSPYAYQWDNGAGNQTTQTATGLAAGTFLVTVSDGVGCTDVVTVGLSNAGASTLTIVGSDVTCNGGNNGLASSAISGGTPPLTYSWSNGSNSPNISGLIANTYTLTVTDSANCISVASVTISEPSVIIVSMSYLNTSGTACDGMATATVSGGTPPYTYQWDDPGTQTNAIAAGLCLGNYNVIVTDANSCSKTGSIYVDSIAMGMEVMGQELGFLLYPNPSNGAFSVEFLSGDVAVEFIEVVNILGQQAYFREIHAKIQSHEIIIQTPDQGVYFLNIVTGSGKMTRKIVLY